MSQENIPIQDFISDINKGKYVIPYFQRPFDWGPGMVNDLFNSILHEYYAGTILLWRLGEVERKKEMWNELWGAIKGENPEIAVLDGQQRLSSVYYALHAPNKKFPNRDSYYYFFIDLRQMILGNEEDTITYKYYPRWRKIDSFMNKKDEWIQKGLFPLCLLSDR
ncbi:MAG: DUF262 domain-containing protein, partial [Methanothrix sp.]|nr:DUF262 domain-containing protein [Methanothrix sp.]